jgi:hypothetical protein
MNILRLKVQISIPEVLLFPFPTTRAWHDSDNPAQAAQAALSMSLGNSKKQMLMGKHVSDNVNLGPVIQTLLSEKRNERNKNSRGMLEDHPH